MSPFLNLRIVLHVKQFLIARILSDPRILFVVTPFPVTNFEKVSKSLKNYELANFEKRLKFITKNRNQNSRIYIKICISQFVCLCVCLFVQFFDALPMVQKICQRYVWIAYNQARKMKLFQIRLEDEKNIKTQHHIYRKCLFVRHRCLFVCHTELSSFPNSKHTSYSFPNVCLSVIILFP